MTVNEHLLVLLAEECAETAHRASKCLRFTLDETQPDQPLNNVQRLVLEFNDIVAVMELLKAEGMIKGAIYNHAHIEEKKIKVKEHSKN